LLEMPERFVVTLGFKGDQPQAQMGVCVAGVPGGLALETPDVLVSSEPAANDSIANRAGTASSRAGPRVSANGTALGQPRVERREGTEFPRVA
jgi:hypothetical protein